MKVTNSAMQLVALGLCSLALGVPGTADARGRKNNPTEPPPPPPPPATACATAGSTQPAYAIFLDGYPGRFQLVDLPCLDSQPAEPAIPRELTLNLGGRAKRFEMANGDVFYDGTQYRFVFGGRSGSGEQWGIWGGVIDVAGNSVNNIHRIVTTDTIAEQDPRFSWDGQTIIYKSDGRIMSVAVDSAPQSWGNGYAMPLLLAEETGCELWAPSMYTVNLFSYGRRCNNDPSTDRIAVVSGGITTVIENTGGGVDRFAHFTRDGHVVYSHLDVDAWRANLWRTDRVSGPQEILDATSSDDDAHADRQFDVISFSGWNDATDLYDMYIASYWDAAAPALRITAGIQVLGAVTFGYSEVLP